MLPLSEFQQNPTTKGSLIYEKIPADLLTPLCVLENFQAKALLESAHIQMGKGRYSLLVLNIAFMLIKDKGQYILIDSKQQRHDLGQLNPTYRYLDWLLLLKDLAPETELPCPLPLGGIGYLGFEFFSEIEDIQFKNKKRVEHYDCAFIFARDMMVFDHLYDEAYIFCVSYGTESYKPSKEHLQHLIHDIRAIQPKQTQKKTYPSTLIDHNIPYQNFVTHIQEEIYKGNLMQCVPSRSVEIHTNLPPMEAYRNLRHENPSPYMFYCDFGAFIIIGASPEIMVKVEDSNLILRPIAGSCKRGRNLAEDELLEQQLLNDPKENAEHLMLVDLGRNDLGKVSKAGSVKVKEFCTIERYARITHIASEINSTIEDNKNIKDVIYATFPAGTVSGAPKIAAIKTIASLEPYSRGFYAGCVGYIDSKNNFNSCITIRTALYKQGVYYLQAGSGIVYDSNPQSEWLETENKMQSLYKAIMQEEGK